MKTVKNCNCLNNKSFADCPAHKKPAQQRIVERQIAAEERRAEIKNLSDADLKDLLILIQGSW